MSVGTAAGSITAAGQGTTSNVSINMLSGTFIAPEDPKAPAGTSTGVMSSTTIDTITSTGMVSTGSISGMSVGTAAGSITAAGQGTTSNVSINMLSGSFTAPEDPNVPAGTPTGMMSNTTINTITSTGTVSTGSISGMSVGTAAGSITSAGQGTTSNVSIGTLSGLFTAPMDQTAGSGVTSNTTIDSITSTGIVSTGIISGMSVGAIDDGGTIAAEKTVNNLQIDVLNGGNFSAGEFQIVTAKKVIAEEVKLVEPTATRTLKLSAVPGFDRPASYRFYYDGSGGGNAKVTARIDAGTVSNPRGDFSLLTDTVGTSGSGGTGIDLAALYGAGKATLRNVVVAGDLTPGDAKPAFVGLLATTPGGVQLPDD